MKPFEAAAIFSLSLCFVCADWQPPVYDIDLETDPEHRWDKVIDDHKSALPQIQKIVRQYLPKWSETMVFYMAKYIDELFPTEYAQEIKGVSRVSGLPLGETVLLNILYDLVAFDRSNPLGACTSIVAKDREGVIWHGRNLDFNYGEFLRNVTIIANFRQKQKVVFSSLTFAFYVGTMTGQRPGAFSLSLNERFYGGLIDNIVMAILTRFRHPASLVMRQALQYNTNFVSATKFLSRVKLTAPCYLIVGGLGGDQGVVLTRNRINTADAWYLNDERWFVLETNYDHWKQPPAHDQRSKVANDGMKRIGQNNTTPTTMFGVLSTPPVQNNNTIFSTVMSASHPSVLQSFTRVRGHL